MSQHNFSEPDEAGAAYRAGINNALQALASQSSGASEPSTKYVYQVWADTTQNVLKRRNAANSAWIKWATLAETFVVSRSSNTILGESDHTRTIVATSNFTQTFDAVSALKDGWYVDYRIESGVSITFDPNASENIDGAATKTVTGPAAGSIYCDGSAFKTGGLMPDCGTWTPSVGGSATYIAQAGSFVRVGRVVFIHGQMQINAIGTGNTTTISGLPFTAASGADGNGTFMVNQSASLATAVVSLTGQVLGGASSIQFRSRTAANAADAANALFQASALVDFNGFYFT